MEEKNSIWGYVLVAVVTIVIGVGIGLGISYFTKEDKEPNVSVDNDSNWEEKDDKVNNELTCSDEEIKLLLSGYLNLKAKNKYDPVSILEEFKLLPVNTECLECDVEEDENGYIYSRAIYSDFKDLMLLYMTENLFEKEFGNTFKEENGYVKYSDIYLSPGYKVRVDNITKISENSYKAEITKIVLTNAPEPLESSGNIKFELEIVNNKCVISSIEDI